MKRKRKVPFYPPSIYEGDSNNSGKLLSAGIILILLILIIIKFLT